ncbi:alpha,alpha-trehalose-phosphate synthase (UDP-forming) [Aquibaculum arenosum]|uniref:Trehalose-6-phosphate synthase n=1 Tax=Aquibaculum arenosum TaxID=3032591 RepID=A0ABT5YM08_9PROT|nr:alpha,alpha-trehalose-phosphate synthase (UDP-forming) [Fodinicurvata sp. CAU 1616]MDF2095892.1 alpha,alpha-trehalose-phosphate synthase (UDP-forming) [Fodinicurvata sp. CAU 1616]
MRRLLLLSNRVTPLQTGAGNRGATGGLAVAIHDALSESHGLWFGWSGRIAESETERRLNTEEKEHYQVTTIDLTEAELEGYYNGYSNGVLWPILHYRADLMEYHSAHFEAYRRVNELFAEQLAQQVRPGDLIWIHDYHLLLVAQELRKRGVDNPIGFFLHTPFPAPEALTALPNHRELMEGLCHCDLIGLQTRTDLRAFLDYLRFEAGGKVLDEERIECFGRRLRAGCFPISIDPDGFAQAAAQVRNEARRRLLISLDGRRLLLGVDRLDYTKGLPQRILSYEHLLEHHPEHRRRIAFLQIAPHSRSEVPEYIHLRRRLEELSGHVNGRFAELDWVPLRYVNRGLSRSALAGVLRIASVALVTPLRDGMNLVAKEYVAAQDPEDPGVLLLSRFAGAAHELDAALIVNPLDYEATGEALHQALAMSLEERQERWQAMMEVIRAQDVTRWWRSFVTRLAEDAWEA